MGIDAGFDMVPRLSKGATDKNNWDRFTCAIKEYYRNDKQVEVQANYIIFKVGEHPRLPLEGHKFLRFSSKVSGATATKTHAWEYINSVTSLARAHFGSRIQAWSNAVDQLGFYDWGQVHDSIKSYEKPDDPETQPTMVHQPTDSPSIEDVDIALFSMTDIPGRGKGLVARTNIPKGTRILCEKPLFTVKRPMSPDALETFIASKLASLSREEQRQFLSLHNNFRGKYPFGGIVRTNALPCGAGASVGGVYTTICRINHSCLPNCHNSWNSDTKHETIHAIRPIEAGEEITIRYDKGGSSTARQASLKESFGFQCDCVQCSLPPPMLKASDSRRESIQRLDDSIGDPWRMSSNPNASLGDCYSLLQCLREEFDGHPEALLARLYYDAFQICIAHGDQARAAIFAQKAYEARVICEGEDSPETQHAKSLAANPSSHHSYGLCSMKWKTKKEMAPKGLDSGQMEKWLFRKQK